MPIDQPQTDPANWCGIILAGGAASRLGGVNKALQRYRDKPLITYPLSVLAQTCSEIVISANRDLEQLSAFGCPIVTDQTKGFQGPLEGIKASTRSSAATYFLILACDMPHIKREQIAPLQLALTSNQSLDAALYCTHESWQPGLMAVTASAAQSLQINWPLENRSLKGWLGHLNTKVIPEARSELFANLNRPADFGAER